jgi:hypothetical protein
MKLNLQPGGRQQQHRADGYHPQRAEAGFSHPAGGNTASWRLIWGDQQPRNRFDGTFDTWNYLDHFALLPGTPASATTPVRPTSATACRPVGRHRPVHQGRKAGQHRSAVGEVKGHSGSQGPTDPGTSTPTFAPTLSNSTMRRKWAVSGYPPPKSGQPGRWFQAKRTEGCCGTCKGSGA